MSRNVIIICNTFSQLLMAIQLKSSILADDQLSVVATDKSPMNESLLERVRKLGYFDEVSFAKSMHYCRRKDTIKEKLADVIDIAKGRNITGISSGIYDLFMYYNLDMTTLALFADLYKYNKNIKCARYEEGILSYNNPMHSNAKFQLGYILRNLFGKRSIVQRTRTFYCCHPSLYRGDLSVVEVPRIDVSGSIGRIMKYIFDIKDETLVYREKYIYFSSVYDIEGGAPIGELELVRAIRDHVGNDNLLVKVHPRDTRTIYSDENFHVDKNSKLPWEAIQLNIDCLDKVFITTNSGSVLSINMLIEPMPETVFTYDCCHYEVNPWAMNTIKNIKVLLQDVNYKKYLKNVRTIKSIEEL